MADIYRGSRLTIAACSSNSSTQGIFNDQSTSDLDDFGSLIRIDNRLHDGRHSTLYCFSPSLARMTGPRLRNIYLSTLSARAWCLQELLLSPRILHYTQSQLLWECAHLNAYEDGLELRHESEGVKYRNLFRGYGESPSPRGNRASLLWYNGLVPRYSRGKLTHGSDKLVAVGALATTFNLIYHWEYLAGLWRESLVYGLRWCRNGPGKKASSYRCPSWSWASQDSAIQYTVSDNWDLPIPDDLIVAAEVETDPRNQYGAVTGGYIILRTFSVPAIVTRNSGSGTWMMACDLPIQGEAQFYAKMDDADFPTKQVECIYLGSGTRGFLILERDGQENTYKRVGIVQYFGHNVDIFQFESIPKSLVTII